MEEDFNFKKWWSKNINGSEEKWYNLYTKIPTIIFVLSMITYFVLGIIDAVELIWLDTDTGFGAWLLWQLIGLAASSISLVFTKIAMSPILIKVKYLKEIAENTKKNTANV